MGDIIYGDKNEFKDRSRKIEFNLNYFADGKDWSRQEQQKGDAETEEADYEEVVEPAEGKSDGGDQTADNEELNYFQPELHLKQLLAGDWFAELRTDKKYDEKWRKAFVESLMLSKYREGIARDWALIRSKKEFVKCCVVGCLKEAGVLKGGYDAIARAIYGEDKYRIYGNYIGRGKKQHYADWIDDYVKTH